MTKHIPVDCKTEACPHYKTCCHMPTSAYYVDDRIDIMVIGQGAGWQEERDNKPWVGDAGQLLRKVFRSIFDGDQKLGVALANTVRCRPTEPAPGRRSGVKDRIPTEEEIAFCKPYLSKDIDELNPYLVLLAGGSAASAFGYKGSVGSLRGKPHIVHDHIYMVTYHPAGVLRQPHLGKEFRKDVEKACYLAKTYVRSEGKLPF